ncbi:MAG: nucleotidyltransferase family protein [Clostridiaceae bacterium]
MMSVDGVVLAAGLSSRMGTNKMLLKLGEKTVIERCIESMYDYCSHIIVVGGHYYSETYELLKPYSKVTMVLNKDYHEGMFSSVKEGVRKVRGGRFFLTPGDYPLIKGETCKVMLKCKDDIVIPSYEGKKGHPILIDSNLIFDILNNTDYKTMKDFIHSQGYTTVAVRDKGILADMDTPEVYENLLSEFMLLKI